MTMRMQGSKFFGFTGGWFTSRGFAVPRTRRPQRG